MIDNSKLVLPFVPETDDGDTFIYTELLDRLRGKGNNGHRILKTFYHRSREEFAEQFEVIKQLCELTSVRAYTRLSPRSYRTVGRQFTRLVVEASLTDNYAGMKSLYNRACGTVTPNEKLWLYDVDEVGAGSLKLGLALHEAGLLRATIPSRKGMHYITTPHRPDLFAELSVGAAIHKDNPTNLYIPDGAA